MIDSIYLPTLRDLADILFLTVMVYSLYMWFRGTRALRVLIGLVVLGGIYSLAKTWGLFLTTWVFQVLWQVLIILLLILFQSEIRQVLEKVSPLRYLRSLRRPSHGTLLHELAQVVFDMAHELTGAIIVLPREDNISQWVHSGHKIMSLPEPLLIKSIFHPHSPTHDGALILDQGHLTQMGCILPLSKKEALPEKFGTRHRAALGLSERSDAVCLIVSEERGEVRSAVAGELQLWKDTDLLSGQLQEWLGGSEVPWPSLKIFLKHALKKNWHQKIASLALVSLTWLVLSGQQEIKTTVMAPVRYANIKSGYAVDNDPLKSVTITVSGKRDRLKPLRNRETPLFADLSSLTEGSHLLKFSEENINLPLGVTVIQIVPDEIQLTLRRRGVEEEVKEGVKARR